MRYRLETILVVMTLAKICGADNPSGIVDWAKHRAELLCDALKLERRSMPHHSTYRRISEEVICVEELEEAVSDVLSGKRYTHHGHKLRLFSLREAQFVTEGIIFWQTGFIGYGWKSLARYTG